MALLVVLELYDICETKAVRLHLSESLQFNWYGKNVGSFKVKGNYFTLNAVWIVVTPIPGKWKSKSL